METNEPNPGARRRRSSLVSWQLMKATSLMDELHVNPFERALRNASPGRMLIKLSTSSFFTLAMYSPNFS